MGDFAGLYSLNCIHERREQRSVVLHSVFRNVDDHNTETQLLKVVFVLKTSIDGYQNVTLALGLRDQLGVRKCAPLGLRDSQDFMIGEGLPETRVNAFV
jgi:hypothetical protein